MSDATHRAIEAVWRIESARLIASLARIVRDVGIAEDLAQDALVAALEQWPSQGVPERPGAWLMAAAKNRAIDHLRRNRMRDRKEDEVGAEIESRRADPQAASDEALDNPVGDDLLALVFTSCHPSLPTEARVALTLRLLGGLTTAEIARAFLVPEATIAQRIVRAKRTLADVRADFIVPRGAELAARIPSVLEVIYLVFNEGYSATAGDDWMRPSLCEEAMRLGRVLAGLVREEAEVHGLVALMELQASRTQARTDAQGDPVLLLEQNRDLWSQVLVRRGLEALVRAESLEKARGPYTLQAAIAACHARARTAEATDWERIVVLYGELAEIMPSPVVDLNRAVAVGMAYGPGQALEIVDALVAGGRLRDYHLLPSVRGDLLGKLGRLDEAREEFERAAALTQNQREKALSLRRARDCAEGRRPLR